MGRIITDTVGSLTGNPLKRGVLISEMNGKLFKFIHVDELRENFRLDKVVFSYDYEVIDGGLYMHTALNSDAVLVTEGVAKPRSDEERDKGCDGDYLVFVSSPVRVRYRHDGPWVSVVKCTRLWDSDATTLDIMTGGEYNKIEYSPIWVAIEGIMCRGVAGSGDEWWAIKHLAGLKDGEAFSLEDTYTWDELNPDRLLTPSSDIVIMRSNEHVPGTGHLTASVVMHSGPLFENIRCDNIGGIKVSRLEV